MRRISILLALLLFCGTVYSQKLGQPVKEYDYYTEVNDSTKLYYQLRMHPINGFQDSYYLEVNGICRQVDLIYNGDVREAVDAELKWLRFVPVTENVYYGRSTIVKVYLNKETTVVSLVWYVENKKEKF